MGLERCAGDSSPPYKPLSTNSKSGEYFFLSSNGQYLIKTISEKEYNTLVRLMPAYQYHLRRLPQSLIVRFAGLFRAAVPGTIDTYFMVMQSVFDPAFKLDDKYDMKGSLHKRKKKEGESVGKDEDWLRQNDAFL